MAGSPAKITFKSESDGKVFRASVPATERMTLVRNLLGDLPEEALHNPEITVPHVKGKALGKVIEYAEYHFANDGECDPRQPKDSSSKAASQQPETPKSGKKGRKDNTAKAPATDNKLNKTRPPLKDITNLPIKEAQQGGRRSRSLTDKFSKMALKDDTKVPVKAADVPKAEETQVKESRRDPNDVKKFDEEFVKVDVSTLLQIVTAADFLGYDDLLNLVCSAVADLIKDKAPEDIRAMFGIENDFTPEEEERVRRECGWAFR